MARVGTTADPDQDRLWDIDFAEFGFRSDDGLSSWIEPLRPPPEPRRTIEPPTTGARIAHVQAGSSGIEDLEVSIVCPECHTKVLLDVAREAAMRTAVALLGQTGDADDAPETSRSEALAEEYDEPAPDSTWRARSAAIREELSMLLMSLPVSEVMRSPASFVRGSARISTLSTLFTGGDTSGVIVVDDDDRPIGMITPAQLVRVLFSVSRERCEGLHVRNVMLSRTFCVRMDAPLARVMELCCAESACKIAVVGEDGKLAGYVSQAELLCYLGK